MNSAHKCTNSACRVYVFPVHNFAYLQRTDSCIWLGQMLEVLCGNLLNITAIVSMKAWMEKDFYSIHFINAQENDQDD